MTNDATVAVADAVVGLLNSPATATFTPSFTAVRSYRPMYSLEDLKTLRVTVVPRGIAEEAITRTTSQDDPTVNVAVQQWCSNTANATLDPLMGLVDQIRQALRLQRLDSPSAMWIKTETNPIYSAEHLDQHKVFTSVLAVTYRIIR